MIENIYIFKISKDEIRLSWIFTAKRNGMQEPISMVAHVLSPIRHNNECADAMRDSNLLCVRMETDRDQCSDPNIEILDEGTAIA